MPFKKPFDATTGQVSDCPVAVHCLNMLGTLWKKNKLAVVVFGAACVVAIFFAIRLTLFTIYWSDPARRDAVIEGWQTPGYVAMSWKVPRTVIADALGIQEGDRARQSLEDIAETRGVPIEVLISELERAIASFRADAK